MSDEIQDKKVDATILAASGEGTLTEGHQILEQLRILLRQREATIGRLEQQKLELVEENRCLKAKLKSVEELQIQGLRIIRGAPAARDNNQGDTGDEANAGLAEEQEEREEITYKEILRSMFPLQEG